MLGGAERSGELEFRLGCKERGRGEAGTPSLESR